MASTGASVGAFQENILQKMFLNAILMSRTLPCVGEGFAVCLVDIFQNTQSQLSLF